MKTKKQQRILKGARLYFDAYFTPTQRDIEVKYFDPLSLKKN